MKCWRYGLTADRLFSLRFVFRNKYTNSLNLSLNLNLTPETVTHSIPS